MLIRRLFLLALVFGIPFYAHIAKAEYRVHKLAILGPDGKITKEVVSTLDHMQYAQYFEIPQNHHVQYEESWKCYGNTNNFQVYCPNPRDASASRLPSSVKSN